jgi:hypothetical protein
MKEAAMTYVRRLQNNLESARQTVIVRMEQVKKKQKLTYDASRREATYKKNDLVLIFKPLRKIGRSEKLLHRWLGPYLVVRQTTPVNYEVILQSGRQKSDIVHVARMKPFFDLATLHDEERDQLVTAESPTTADDDDDSLSKLPTGEHPDSPPPIARFGSAQRVAPLGDEQLGKATDNGGSRPRATTRNSHGRHGQSRRN